MYMGMLYVVYTCMDVHKYVFTYVCMYVGKYVCMYVCMFHLVFVCLASPTVPSPHNCRKLIQL